MDPAAIITGIVCLILGIGIGRAGPAVSAWWDDLTAGIAHVISVVGGTVLVVLVLGGLAYAAGIRP